MLKLEEHIQHPYTMLLEANIIIIGSVADLSSVGTKIAVEKDWVVVIAGSDKSLLASKYAGSGQLNIWISMITTCCISAEKGIFVNFFSKRSGIEPQGVAVLCSMARFFALTVPLSTLTV